MWVSAGTQIQFGTNSNPADNDNNYYSGTAGGGYMTTGSPYGGAGGSPGGFTRVCFPPSVDYFLSPRNTEK